MKTPSLFTRLISHGAILAGSLAPSTERPDIAPFKSRVKELLQKLQEQGDALPPSVAPQQEEQEVAPRRVLYSSEFDAAAFQSVPNASVEVAREPSLECRSMQLFKMDNGQLKAEMLNHLHDEGWSANKFQEFLTIDTFKEGEEMNKFVRTTGSGAFIVQNENGAIVFSTNAAINHSSEEAQATGFMPGLNIAGIRGEEVDRCPGDPIPLRPFTITEHTNDEIVGQGLELELEAMGSSYRKVSGKVFPMSVTGKDERGEVLQQHTVLMMKIAESDIKNPTDLIGFHGTAAYLQESKEECAGICTGLWRNKNEDGSYTWMLFIVGPDEIRSLQGFIDGNRGVGPDDTAPDYDPREKGGNTDF